MNKYEEFLMTFDREDRNKALLLINEVLAKNNKNSYYVCERARLYLAMNRLADARTECTKALAIDPKNLQARRTRSYCFFMMKDYKKGLDDINIALKDETPYPVDMNFTGDYENRAKALLLLGKKNEAKKDERYIAADRFLRQAIQAREGAGVEKAIACCDQALALDSTSLRALLFKALCLNNLMRMPECIKVLNRLLSLKPNLVPALYLRADCYRETKQPEKAIADLSKIIEINPPLVMFKYAAHTGRLRDKFTYADDQVVNVADIYFLRANCFATLKKYDLALKDFEKVLELDPKEFKAALGAGEINAELRNYQAALKDYDWALKINPKFWDAYIARSRCYESLHETDKAIADLSHVIGAQPKDAGAFLLRAELYERLKQFKKAIDDYTQVIAIAPADDDAYKSRADIYTKLGDYKKAIADYDAALKLGSEDSEAIKKARARALKLMSAKSH